MALTLEQLNEKYGRPSRYEGGTPMTPENLKLEEMRMKNIREGKPSIREGRFAETLADLKQTTSSILSRFTSGADKIAEIDKNQPKTVQAIESWDVGVGTAQGVFDEVFQGIIKVALSKNQEQVAKDIVTKAVQNPLIQNYAQEVKKASDFIKEQNPDLYKGLKAGINTILLGAEVFGSGFLGKGVSKTKKVIGEGLDTLGDIAKRTPGLPGGAVAIAPEVATEATPGILSGIKQQVTELGERFPRAIDKAKQATQNATERAARIADSSPSIGNAIKVKLDDKIINTVIDADDITLKGYKEIVDIASNSSKKLGLKQRPEIIAGLAAEKQFGFIANQRKIVGAKIGAIVDDLSKTTKIDMTDSYNQLKGILGKQGVVKTPDGKFIIDPSLYTPQQEKLIEKLYDLAMKGGDELTPRQVYNFDKKFSTLKREAKVEKISNVIFETADGNKNMFQVFRDIFSSKLDDLTPEIRDLNREYRSLMSIIGDVEDSIIKGGKFDVVKGVDSAEFAQTNLRRMLSDAQSATAYREIARQMDELSRALGYTGANPEELITFATEMRKLFPDIIPETSFTGGIRTGIKGGTVDLLNKALKVGTPDLVDQQRALIRLLDELLQSPKKGNPAVGQTVKKGNLLQEAKPTLKWLDENADLETSELVAKDAFNNGYRVFPVDEFSADMGKPSTYPEIKSINDFKDTKADQFYVYKPEVTPETYLITEAKKYKSAEEFVKAQGDIAYHGTDVDFDKFKTNLEGIFFTNKEGKNVLASKNNIKQAFLDIKNPFTISTNSILRLIKSNKDFAFDLKASVSKADIADIDLAIKIQNKFNQSDKRTRALIKSQVEKNGFDSIIIPEDIFPDGEKIKSTVVFSPDQIKTKSQLIDIWNKANKYAK